MSSPSPITILGTQLPKLTSVKILNFSGFGLGRTDAKRFPQLTEFCTSMGPKLRSLTVADTPPPQHEDHGAVPDQNAAQNPFQRGHFDQAFAFDQPFAFGQSNPVRFEHNGDGVHLFFRTLAEKCPNLEIFEFNVVCRAGSGRLWGTDLTYLLENCTKLTKLSIRMTEVEENMFDGYDYIVRRKSSSKPLALQHLHVLDHAALSSDERRTQNLKSALPGSFRNCSWHEHLALGPSWDD